MSAFTDADLRYLSVERVLARIATVGQDGTPHVAPVGWSYNATHDTIDIGGHSLKRTKKYWDVKRSGRAAVVIDDVLAPLQPRGVEVRGRAGAIEGPPPMIRIHPQRIVSWGLDDATRMPGRRTPETSHRCPPRRRRADGSCIGRRPGLMVRPTVGPGRGDNGDGRSPQ